MNSKKDKILFLVIFLLFIGTFLGIFFFGKPNNSENEEIQKEEICYISEDGNKKRIIKINISKIKNLENPIITGKDILYIDNEIKLKSTFGGFLKNNTYDIFIKLDPKHIEERLYQKIKKGEKKGIVEGEILTSYYRITKTKTEKNETIISKLLKPESLKDIKFNDNYLIQQIDCSKIDLNFE